MALSILYLGLTAQRVSLSVKTDDKITMHGFCYWQELQLKSKDTSFTYKLHSGNPDVIKNLKPGTYTLTARSLFNNVLCKKVEVNKKTPLVKFKGLQAYHKRMSDGKNLSEKLKLNDTLYILYNSNANEADREKIAITKTAQGYKALQYRGISNEVFQDMQFKDEFYKDVIKFESEGKKANSPKGETAPKAEIYTVALNKELVSFIVPGEWGGLGKLKAMLFLVEQK
jgi:hypothetical protein